MQHMQGTAGQSCVVMGKRIGSLKITNQTYPGNVHVWNNSVWGVCMGCVYGVCVWGVWGRRSVFLFVFLLLVFFICTGCFCLHNIYNIHDVHSMRALFHQSTTHSNNLPLAYIVIPNLTPNTTPPHAGGRVEFQRCWRIISEPRRDRPLSGLAVSRSFGDLDFKEPKEYVLLKGGICECVWGEVYVGV